MADLISPSVSFLPTSLNRHFPLLRSAHSSPTIRFSFVSSVVIRSAPLGRRPRRGRGVGLVAVRGYNVSVMAGSTPAIDGKHVKAEVRDHLFISYAWEDQVFAKWLALRLTAEGYKVWIDQMKLLGGESWPSDIDEAIKKRTCRMLGLLSRHSINKDNPRKERTLALGIAKQPGRKGFLIPINVDGLPPTELDWLTSDLTFIPFSQSWAQGLQQLLKLLDREECPRGDVDEGRSIAARIAASSELIREEPESLVSNMCRFTSVPTMMHAYRVRPKLDYGSNALRDARRDWGFHPLSPHRVLAFHPPPADLGTWLKVERAQSYRWAELDEIEGVLPHNAVSRTLRGVIEAELARRGFTWSGAAEGYVVPGAHGKMVRLTLPSGKTTNVKLSGERTFFRVGQPKQLYHYRTAVKVFIEQTDDGYRAVFRLQYDLTEPSGGSLPPTQRNSRRKHLTRTWSNYHWMVRHLALIQMITGESDAVSVGTDTDDTVVLRSEPMSFTVGVSIDEEKVKAAPDISDEEADASPVDDDDEQVDEHVDDEGEADDES